MATYYVVISKKKGLKMSHKCLKKWTEVYPQGTTEGNEEQRFFIALARNAKWEWRSAQAISKESGLPVKRVEEIIQKYYKKGMVLQAPQNEDLWGYWERVMPDGPCNASIGQKDQKDRVDKAVKKNQNP